MSCVMACVHVCMCVVCGCVFLFFFKKMSCDEVQYVCIIIRLLDVQYDYE